MPGYKVPTGPRCPDVYHSLLLQGLSDWFDCNPEQEKHFTFRSNTTHAQLKKSFYVMEQCLSLLCGMYFDVFQTILYFSF